MNTLLPTVLTGCLVAYALLFRPRLRSRATLTVGIFALAFLLAGSLFARRFFELGAPLSLFALAVLVREQSLQGLPPILPRWGRKLAAAAIFLGVLWTLSALRFYLMDGPVELRMEDGQVFTMDHIFGSISKNSEGPGSHFAS